MLGTALAALLAACAPGGGAGLVPLDSHSEYVPPATEGEPAGQAAAQMPDLLVRPAITSSRVYNLAALIDIAEENNPETRIAWQRARQAALGVGVAEATFLPQLSIEAVAGYQYLGQGTAGLTVDSSSVPGISVVKNGLPSSITVPDGVITTKTKEAVPSATLKWLLFDFGGRAADVCAGGRVPGDCARHSRGDRR